MRILSGDEMRALDAQESGRVGAVELMRRAGVAIASLTTTFTNGRNLTGVAGPGNNGGDVFAAFAELDRSYERVVIEMESPLPSDARQDARKRATAAGVTIVQAPGGRAIEDADLCLDGLLGAGARLPLAPDVAALTRRLRNHPNVLAVDIPTGLDATTGAADADAVLARATIALGALKLGLFAESVRAHVGELWFDAIGFEATGGSLPAATCTLSETEAAALVPIRGADADKRDSGAPLIVAGSEQFPGAAILCARAAARAGAGYVTVATPAPAAQTLRAHLVEQVVVAFDDRDPAQAIETIAGLANHAGAIALGPGLGLSETTGAIVRGVIEASDLPIVIDASALYHLSKNLGILRGKPVVLTPHAREFARLSGKGTVAPGDRVARLRSFVSEHDVVTLLKGPVTLVDDGRRVYFNPTGSNALSTAGTGDVLSGVIATLLAQKLAPFEAAALGAFWHGQAGQVARGWRAVGVVAGDVIESLADAVPVREEAHALPIRIF